MVPHKRSDSMHVCAQWEKHIQLTPQSKGMVPHKVGRIKPSSITALVVECGQTQWDRMLTMERTECVG